MATASVVNVDGARVAYRLHGRGPAAVLVNGTAALDAHWGPVIAEFSTHRTVISLDYSGSGDTTDDGSALSLQKLARQVSEVARAAGVDRFRSSRPFPRSGDCYSACSQFRRSGPIPHCGRRLFAGRRAAAQASIRALA
jgi:hypothetical protein